METSAGSGIKVLIADDQKSNRHILEVFLRREGHTVIVANDGAEAVALHRQERPDLVLMDIMMPVMDGLEAARLINAESGEIHTPILFLSMLNDRQTMLDGLELADDFISKPINFGLLRAKLRAFIRQVQIHRTFRVQQRRIELYNDEMRRESEVASFILNRVLAHTEPPNGHSLQYRVVPSALFSGDVVFARRTPSGRLHVLLADAVGHGLPAAINILPLFFPFDGMSRKGYPISDRGARTQPAHTRSAACRSFRRRDPGQHRRRGGRRRCLERRAIRRHCWLGPTAGSRNVSTRCKWHLASTKTIRHCSRRSAWVFRQASS
jgi:CheY-like chemotaxis protein